MVLRVLRAAATLIAIAVVRAQDSSTEYDPSTDFCRRFGHQTTVIDRRLYIDGGYVDYGGSISSETFNYTNTYLLYLGLDNFVQDFPILHATLSKPSNVPSVVGGTLWADTVNKYFYLYGGEYNWTTFPPSQFNLWCYDALYDKWEPKERDSTISSIPSLSYGASVVVDDRALAYYYGGWKSNASELGWNGNPAAQSSLIKYDMVENTWDTMTFVDNTTRAEGVMFYIPVSDSGMLVYFGGVQQTSNGSSIGVPLDQIYLYDIASEKSYVQPTTGDTPGMRRKFCGGVNWAEDQSSYNIYFFGGLQPPSEQGYGYGDVWILSLPSFIWTKWYPAQGNPDRFQHHSLSCNVIDESQMIIMGGYFPDSSFIECDASNVWGQHNLNLGAVNDEDAQWYGFLPNLNTYRVPQDIFTVIGGGPNGGATLTAPADGWADPDLEVYFGRQYKPTTTRKPTRDVSRATGVTSTSAAKDSKHSNIGAIAGGVVGGVFGLILILVAALCCLRRRRRRRDRERVDRPETSQPGPPGPFQHIDNRPTAERHFSGMSEPARAVQSPHMSDTGSAHRIPSGGSPPPQFAPFDSSSWHQYHTVHSQGQGADWTPVPVYYTPTQSSPQLQYFTQAQQPQPQPQTYYPPPPEPQQPQPQSQSYYPPPPDPQEYGQARQQPATFEMPGVRSPVHMSDMPVQRSKGSDDATGEGVGLAKYA